MRLDELYEPYVIHRINPMRSDVKSESKPKEKTKTPLSRSEVARLGGIAARGKSGRPRMWTPEERKEQARVRVREWKKKNKESQNAS